jgi:hypothetical protein
MATLFPPGACSDHLCVSAASTPTLATKGQGVQRILFLQRIEILFNENEIYGGNKTDLLRDQSTRERRHAASREKTPSERFLGPFAEHSLPFER